MLTDTQHENVCRALLDLARLDGMWTKAGPTQQAIEALESNTLSSAEEAMLRVALDVHNGSGHADMAQLLKLDDRNLRAVGQLLSALVDGSAAIERWTAAYG